jgi:hypothetical protein
MKKYIICIILYLISIKSAFGGDFIVGNLTNNLTEGKSPLEIFCEPRFNDYYPSRLIDIERSERNYVVYNLHIVYLDFSSIPQIKTVQAIIPKEFTIENCHVGSDQFEFYFLTKRKEIIVSIPSVKNDTLCDYEHSLRLTPLNYSLPEIPGIMTYERYKPFIDNRYIGIRQCGAYTLYYYNLKRKQKELYEKCLDFFMKDYSEKKHD